MTYKKNQIAFRVSGKYALFTDPVTKLGGEKCTYQIPTYEALKGIVKAIYWKPTLIWHIDELRVMKSIRTQSKNMKPMLYDNSSKNALATYTYLVEAVYEVKAHFVWNPFREDLKNDRNGGKHFNIIKRMIEKGGRRDVCLGTRECQAYVEPLPSIDYASGFSKENSAYQETDELSFGLMFHSFDYPDETGKEELYANYSIPVMKKGIIVFEQPKQIQTKRFIKNLKANPPQSCGLKEKEIQNELA